MKKHLFFAFAGVLAFSLAFFTACSDDPADDPDVPLADLVKTVWAGETPRDGDWLTLTFRPDGEVVASFVIDNTSNKWTFTYNSAAKTGAISTGGGWAGPAPEGFSISTDAKTLTVPNYGGHGAEKTFKRLRQADLTIDTDPFTPGTLSTDLVGSVWGGTTPADDGKSWLTLAFRAKGTGETSMTGTNVAVISYAHDSTTAVWDYVYDSSAKSGTAPTNGHKTDGTTTTWNPGAYTISADGKTLTFTSFMGEARTFKRYR